jgi:hypothetical protein
VKLGDLHLAYQVLGTGPRDILMFDQWFSHMDAQWDVLPLAGFRERLASFGRLIMFDKRGAGLSDPVPTMEHPTLEGWMDDAAAVLDAVGSEKAGCSAPPLRRPTRTEWPAWCSSTVSPASSRPTTTQSATHRRMSKPRWRRSNPAPGTG